MSQKKINKIKASSIHNTQPKKDPISTTIIREEDDPDKDIGYKWIPYFRDSDNVYVNDLAKRARRSSTVLLTKSRHLQWVRRLPLK